MPRPTLTARAVQPVVAGLDTLGVDSGAVLSACGISPAVVADPGGRVPHGAMMRAWRLAVERSGDPDLGLHVAEAVPFSALELHGYALLASPTLGAAYGRACRYQRLIHESTALTLERHGDRAILRHALPDGSAVARQPAEFLVALWVRFGRQFLGADWAPARVDFAHPRPRRVAEHRRVLGRAPGFASGRTAIELPCADLDRPNPRSDEALAALLDRFADVLLAKLPRDRTMAERLRTWLGRNLADGAPTAAGAARALARSPRSLHRDLAAEGTSFRRVLDQLRYERAVASLDAGDASQREIAFLLGFGEVSSFLRAFRRWTGSTPGRFRASRPR